MKRFLVYFILFVIAFTPNAFAHEYNKLNNLYYILETNHNQHIDYKRISLSSVSLLNNYDKNFRLFYNESKLFMYYENNLVKTLELPIKNIPNEWKNVLSNIFDIYSNFKDDTNKTE